VRKSTLILKAKRLFRCDEVEVSEFDSGKKFLITSVKRISDGEWFKNSPTECMVPQRFEYMERTCVASGSTYLELWQKAKEHKWMEKHPRRAWEKLLGIKIPKSWKVAGEGRTGGVPRPAPGR
jgi:hypothetical protein